MGWNHQKLLTIYTISYNLNKIRYPWKASLASACHFADEVLVAECGSTDGTAGELAQFAIANPKVRVLQGHWGTECEVQQEMAQLCVKEMNGDWGYYLNADEVLHETSDFRLHAMKESGHRFGRGHFTHFLGDFHTTFPFIYETVCRCHYGKNVTWSNDACGLDHTGYQVFDMPVKIYHYGKVHVGRELEAAQKEVEFQALYTKYGFPDRELMDIIKEHGSLNYTTFLRDRWKKNNEVDESKPFTGTHPIFVQDWIKMMETQKRPEIN